MGGPRRNVLSYKFLVLSFGEEEAERKDNAETQRGRGERKSEASSWMDLSGENRKSENGKSKMGRGGDSVD
jgi:hypothetical protein